MFRKRTLANWSTGFDSLAFDDTVSPRRNSIQTFNMFMLSELRENRFFDNETPLNPYCSFWKCLKINNYWSNSYRKSVFFNDMKGKSPGQTKNEANFSVERHCKNLTQRSLHWLNLLNLFKTCSVENNLTRKLNNITAMRQRISAIAYHRILSVLHYPRQSQFSPIIQPGCFLRSVTVWSFRAANFHHRKVSDCNYIMLWL